MCDAPGADVDAACERLRPRGYECVVVCARARHAGHRAWPALQRRPAVVAAPADVAAVVEQFQHASPWRTALDTEPVWLAGKRAALERDVLPRLAGGRDALERAEAAGAVFRGGEPPFVNNVLVPHVVQQYEPNGPFYATGGGGRTVGAAAGADAIAAAAAARPVAFPSLPSTETLESLATFDGRRSPSAFTAVSAGRASPAVAEPAPPTPPKEREKRDSLLCDGDTVDAVLGSVFD